MNRRGEEDLIEYPIQGHDQAKQGSYEYMSSLSRFLHFNKGKFCCVKSNAFKKFNIQELGN